MDRIKKLQALLDVDALLVTSPLDLYYLTGQDVSAGKLFVTSKNAVFFVDGRYFESVSSLASLPVVLDTPTAFADLVSQYKVVAIDSAAMTVQAFLDLQLKGKQWGVEFVPRKGWLTRLRSIKDKEEIELLRKAAELGSQGFDFVLTKIEEGVKEAELALELEWFWRKQGAKGVAFEPIIAFGANSSKPHYRAGTTVLQRRDPVLIDIGVELNKYHSDMTRMAAIEPLQGKMAEIFEIVKEAHERAVSVLRPGVSIAEVDEAARSFIASKGYGEQFTHSLGHGIGLEVHEYPTIRSNSETKNLYFEPGMVVTIEPGIYLPTIGGVRLEDTLVITKEGSENLTQRPICLHSVKKYS